MSNGKATASFFENGTTAQFEYCFKLYPQVLQLKAEKRGKKPQELIRLDQWYQNELPKLIKARGKDAHMIYDELVQTMKWKQSRGKSYPQLSYLVKVNTPRAVMQETKKAFRKLPNLEQAITALSNLKGVGTTMASALLAAAAPHSAPFMADECLMAIPEIEGIDYTTKEYLNFVQHIQATVERLNKEVGGETPIWSPHRVELALWAHYVANDISPELLEDMPGPGAGGVINLNGTINKNSADDSNESRDVDDKVLADDDTNDADDGILGLASRNIATESENENTNPALLVSESSKLATTNDIGGSVLQDGDSNFISNDSTSQEPIIDENTTQTTATTSTDDGEAIGKPIGSDSESNLEAPLNTKRNHNVNDVAITNKQVAHILPNNHNSNKDNKNGKSILHNDAANTNEGEGIAVELAANGNGNGSLSFGGSIKGENSNYAVAAARSTAFTNDEDVSELDEDEDDLPDDEDVDDENDDAIDDDEEESSNSRGHVGKVHALATVNNPNNSSSEHSRIDGSSTSDIAPTIGQKRALHCDVNADIRSGGIEGIDIDSNSEPEIKKLRSD